MATRASRAGKPAPLCRWGILLAVGALAATAACGGEAARRSEAVTTVYLIELDNGSRTTIERAEGLMLAGKEDEARALLRVRLDGLEEQVTKYITTDPELIIADRERIVAAVREDQGRLRNLLAQHRR